MRISPYRKAQLLKVDFGFIHGCGDCANFACAIPLWVRRGYSVGVRCTPDKEPLFRAAGARISAVGLDHPFLHPPSPSKPSLTDDWSGNKTAWNLSQKPCPFIGNYDELWKELTEVRLSLPEPVKDGVAAFLNSLPRPLVCFHPEGNTGQSEKNLSHDQQKEFLCELIDQTNATVLVLDWDNRTFRLNHSRIRHLGDDFRGLDLLELAEVLRSAELVVGVDSGVQHLARAIGCEVLGVWTKHFPSHFALPSDMSLHFLLRSNPWNSWTKFRRNAWNIAENASGGSDMRFLASLVAGVLSAKHLVPTPQRDVYLRSLLGKCRGTDSALCGYSDRHRSFERLFDLGLAGRWFGSGCVRAEEDFAGAGMSDVLFGTFLREMGGSLVVVDIDEANCAFARKWTDRLPVSVVQSCSLAFLRSYSGEPFSVAYLDSLDADVQGHAEHCLEEARLVLPHLEERCAVLIDDTPRHHGKIHGKGTLAVPFLLSQGFRMCYSGYQFLLVRGNHVCA